MEISEIFSIVRSIYDQMPQGIILFDEGGLIKYSNRSAGNILKLKSKDLTNSNLSDFTHPNDIEIEQRLIKTVFNGDAPSTPTLIRKIPSKGTNLSISVLVSKMDGIGLDLVLGVMVLEDASKQVNSEPEIDYLPMIYNHFKELVLLMEIKKGEYIVKDINNSLIREITLPDLNISKEDLIGIKLDKLLRDILGLDESLITDSINRYDQVLQSGKPMQYTREYKIQDRPIYVDAQIIPIFERKRCKYFLWIGQNITREKLSQQKLEKSEEKFRQIVQDQTDMIVRWKPGGIRTFVNEAYCKAFNLTKEEVIGTSFFNSISEKDLPKVKSRFRELTPENPISSEIIEVELSDGSSGWQEWIDRAFFDNNGKVTEYQSVGRDITEKIQIENASRENEQRLARIYHGSTDMMLLWNVINDNGENKFEIESVNRAFEKAIKRHGFDETKNIKGLTPKQYYVELIKQSETILNESIHRFNQVVKTKKEYSFEIRTPTPSGDVHFSSSYIPILDENGNCINILIVSRDTTELQNNLTQLRESEERFEKLSSSTTEGIAVSVNKILVDVNEQLLHMLQYERGEVLGSSISKFVPPESWDLVCKKIEAKDPGPYEGLGMRKDGSLFPVLLKAQSTTYKGEEARITIIYDITEIKKTQEELESTYEELNQLKQKLEDENIYLQRELHEQYKFKNMVYGSESFHNLLQNVERVAPLDVNVLITGETGTGKELIAHAIHNLSNRRDRSMVKINCAAIPKDLVESELFGYEKGAFTGASRRKSGRFELADGSTLFLDEIGEMPWDAQVKLLRVLQEGEFELLGGTKTQKVDVRVVAASNRNLEEEVKQGRFRQDLFYRLNVFPIVIPPLRERPEDIHILLDFFVKKFSKQYKKKIKFITQESIDSMESYNWPGNVRELENVIERAVIISSGQSLNITDVGFSPSRKKRSLRNLKNRTLREVERSHILKSLQSTNWIISGTKGAAEFLGMKPSTLRDRMKKLGIERSESKI